MSISISALERRWLMALSLGVLALASLPYLAGTLTAAPDRVFTGLQVNPLDGVSYLAKMQIGFHGGWLFQLRFTTESGAGAVLFTYFIALGQLARILNLPLIVVFHAARLLGGFALLWQAYALAARLSDSIERRRQMWWLIAVSSGLGWLATLLGRGSSSDLTIAESNTFYSLMANAHFALAVALMIALFVGVLETRRVTVRRVLGLSALSLLLAIIQPFAPFALFAILGVTLLLMWRRDRVWPSAPFLITLGVGAITEPVLIYLYAITQIDPVLREWSLQNQTPSPPVIDYLIGYGLLLVLAIPAARAAWRRRSNWDLLLLAWIGVTALLLYAPIPLQRRLSLGLHVPIALLAAQGLVQIARGRKWPRRFIAAATVPTSILLVLVLIGGAVARDPRIYVTPDESAAFEWLHDHARFDDVVLAAPETGAFIPAFAGQRVVYGHPYETVEAERKRQMAADFFAGQGDRAAVLREVNYVFVGPRERALGQVDVSDLRVVFESGDVAVYAVIKDEGRRMKAEGCGE
jgi:hypothetical protein